MNGYRSGAAATISAHRLWTNLWMGLGQPEDNCGRLVGNSWATAREQHGVHSPLTGQPPPATGAVDAQTPAGLLIQQMSPASTVPMTTTELSFCDIPSTKQARSAPRRCARWDAQRTGGSTS